MPEGTEKVRIASEVVAFVSAVVLRLVTYAKSRIRRRRDRAARKAAGSIAVLERRLAEQYASLEGRLARLETEAQSRVGQDSLSDWRMNQ